jgi:hypothetical protein
LLVRAGRHQFAANLVVADNYESPRLLTRAKRGQADGFKDAIELFLLDRARLVGPNRISPFDKLEEVHVRAYRMKLVVTRVSVSG